MNDRPPRVQHVGRNRPDEAIEVLKRRHALGVLSADDIETAIKMQDDHEGFAAKVLALNLRANDPNAW